MISGKDMADERWRTLMEDPRVELTEEEIARGWHFCWDWDGLLVGPGMAERDCCSCFKHSS